MATNNENGKRYIGQTSYTMERRRAGHEKVALDGSHLPFHCALRKYGAEAFVWTELYLGNDQLDLWRSEIELIEAWDTVIPSGYNLTRGGSGGVPSEDLREELSLATWLAWKRPEFREARTEESRRRWQSPEFVRKQIDAGKCRPVYCENNDTIYLSVTEAARSTGVGRQHIQIVCKGILKCPDLSPSYRIGWRFRNALPWEINLLLEFGGRACSVTSALYFETW